MHYINILINSIKKKKKTLHKPKIKTDFQFPKIRFYLYMRKNKIQSNKFKHTRKIFKFLI